MDFLNILWSVFFTYHFNSKPILSCNESKHSFSESLYYRCIQSSNEKWNNKFVDIEKDRPGKGDIQLLETYLYVSEYKIRYNKHQKPAVRTNNRAETLIK